MIIGSNFSKKHQQFLRAIGDISGGDAERKIQVREVNKKLDYDRTEMKNMLEHLQALGYIEILTIGGPLLYGHVTITSKGLQKYRQLPPVL